MRRELQQITEISELNAVLSAGEVCHLALNDAGKAPYIVALNYGYELDADTRHLTLWFHCATEGYKLDLLRCDSKAGFQIETRLRLMKSKTQMACEYGMEFESIVGAGCLSIVTSDTDRLHGLTCLLRQFGAEDLPMLDTALKRTVVLRLAVEQFTGKRSKGLLPAMA